MERDHLKLGLSEGRISNGPVSNSRALALAIFQTIQNLDSNLLQLLQCSPTFSRTHPPSFPPRTFSQQTPRKAYRSNPRLHFQNCMQNAVAGPVSAKNKHV